MKQPNCGVDSGKENLDPEKLAAPAVNDGPVEGLKNGLHTFDDTNEEELRLHLSDDDDDDKVEGGSKHGKEDKINGFLENTLNGNQKDDDMAGISSPEEKSKLESASIENDKQKEKSTQDEEETENKVEAVTGKGAEVETKPNIGNTSLSDQILSPCHSVEMTNTKEALVEKDVISKQTTGDVEIKVEQNDDETSETSQKSEETFKTENKIKVEELSPTDKTSNTELCDKEGEKQLDEDEPMDIDELLPVSVIPKPPTPTPANCDSVQSPGNIDISLGDTPPRGLPNNPSKEGSEDTGKEKTMKVDRESPVLTNGQLSPGEILDNISDGAAEPTEEDLEVVNLIDVDEEPRSPTDARKNGMKKRPSEDPADSEAIKKSKLEATEKKASTEGQKQKDNHEKFSLYDLYENNFKGLTKHQLNELIAQKFCDILANRGPLGEMRNRSAQQEEDIYRLNRLNNSLKKQLQDAKHIIKRLIDEREVQKRTGRVSNPLRYTRSVGLQVCTSGSFYMRPKAQFSRTSDKVIDLEVSPNSNQSRLQRSFPRHQTRPPGRSSPIRVAIERAVVPTNSLYPVPIRPKQILPNRPEQMIKRPVAIKKGSAAPLAGVHYSSPRTPVSSSNNHLQQNTKQYIVATPIKTIPIGQNNSPVKPLPKPQEKHTPVSSPAPNTPTSAPALEVIDLTDKDEKSSHAEYWLTNVSQQPGLAALDISSKDKTRPFDNVTLQFKVPAPKPPVVSHHQQILGTPSPNSTSVTQITQNGKIPKKGEVVTLPDGTKPGKTIYAVTNDKQLISKTSKPEEKVDVSAFSPLVSVKLPPLPPAPKYGIVPAPPRPLLRISKSNAGIMLSWNFSTLKIPTDIATFELFAYQDRKDNSPKVWNKVGEVKALPLPMACTLTQFVQDQMYHFAVRAIDIHNRIGEFSTPGGIMLTKDI